MWEYAERLKKGLTGIDPVSRDVSVSVDTDEEGLVVGEHSSLTDAPDMYIIRRMVSRARENSSRTVNFESLTRARNSWYWCGVSNRDGFSC